MAIAAEVGPSQHPPILWVSMHSGHMLGKGLQTHAVSHLLLAQSQGLLKQEAAVKFTGFMGCRSPSDKGRHFLQLPNFPPASF